MKPLLKDTINWDRVEHPFNYPIHPNPDVQKELMQKMDLEQKLATTELLDPETREAARAKIIFQLEKIRLNLKALNYTN